MKNDTPDNFKINNFDLLRIFAATQVLIGHSMTHLGLPTRSTWFFVLSRFPGVPIFFVISGFLISASYEKTNSLKIYMQNRLLRILPGLWGCLFITTLVVIVLGFKFFQLSAITWLLLQMVGVIYTPAFLAHFGYDSYNGSLWTIPIELQFYFVLPVLYYLQKKIFKSNAVFIISFIVFTVIAFIYLYIFHPNAMLDVANENYIGKLIRYSFLPHIYMFLLGLLIYKYKIYTATFIRGKGLIWLTGYLVLSIVFSSYRDLDVFFRLLLGVTTISCAYTLPDLSKKIIKLDISYGVYIYHGLVLGMFFQLGLVNKWIYLPYILVISYLLGFLSWTFVEEKFIRMKRKSLMPK